MKKILVVATVLVCITTDILGQTDTSINLRTKSGLLYKIIPATNDSPLLQDGQLVKLNYTVLWKDSMLYSTYDRMPLYQVVRNTNGTTYDLSAVLPLMKQGDSAVIVQEVDSVRKTGAGIPDFLKSGDLVTSTIRILQVFYSDSTARLDFNIEMEKDLPRQKREQEGVRQQIHQEARSRQAKQEKDAMESGEATKQLKEIQSYLAAKKIKAAKTGKGTYVSIQQPGAGVQPDSGKYVTVKYTGRILKTGAVFQTSEYTFQLGVDPVIAGWVEGIRLFKKGGKGRLYIPGFLAYGSHPPEGSPFKPNQALVFEITVTDVKDQP